MTSTKLVFEEYLILDMETSREGESPHPIIPNNDIVHIQYKSSSGTPKGVRWGEEDANDLIHNIAKAEIISGHNLQFDLSYLYKKGIDVLQINPDIKIWDTQVYRKVVVGNRKQLRQDLETTCAAEGITLSKDKDLALLISNTNVGELPYSWVQDRAEKDVLMSEQLFLSQFRKASEQMKGVVFTKSMFSYILGIISFSGLCLQRKALEKLYDDTVKRQDQVLWRLKEISGNDKFKPGSAQQRQKLLFETLKINIDKKNFRNLTKKGALKTDTTVISGLKTTNKLQKEVKDLLLEYSECKARLTKFLTPILSTPYNKVYGQFSIFTADNHRVSSKKIKTEELASIQFQNIPREHRYMIIPEGDKVFFEIDMSQAEFLGAALLSGDKVALSDYYNKFDVHRFTAMYKYKTPMDQITKDQRTAAKELTFTPLYDGAGTTDEEKEYVHVFQEKYKKIFKAQLGWVDEVLATGKLTTPWGISWYFPNEQLRRNGKAVNSSKIYNYPISNFATAECSSIATVMIYKYLLSHPELGARIVNVVHDSIILEVDNNKEVWDTLVSEFKDIFQEGIKEWLKEVYKFEVDARFRCEYGVGNFWGDKQLLVGEF